MGTDHGGPAEQDEQPTGRRRSTFRPSARRTHPSARPPEPPAEPTPAEPAPSVQSPDQSIPDDDLASALEQEVSRLTSALPIIRGLGTPPRASDELVRSIDDQLVLTGDTLAGIERLEAELARGATKQASTTPDSAVPAPAAAPLPPHAPTGGPLTVDSVPIPIVQSTGVSELSGEPELEDDVADDADDVAIAPETGLIPLATPRIAAGTVVLFDGRPRRGPLFGIEQPALEPTPLDYRIGRAARMFWLWFAADASVLTVALGAILAGLGLSIAQLLVAVVIGVALSFVPLGLGTLAGKWSGQPMLVVSRAMFGIVGNIVPTALVLVVRLFWGAALLWLLSVASGHVARDLGWQVDPVVVQWSVFIGGGALALAIAAFGYALIARVQLVLTIVSAVLVVATIAVTWPNVTRGTAETIPAVPWIEAVTGGVYVFAVFGLAWASASGDLARYQGPGSSGAAAMIWACAGVALPGVALTMYGGILARSDPRLGAHLVSDPIGALIGVAPSWFALPLWIGFALSLLSALVLNSYSGGFAVLATGIRMPRWVCVLLAGALVMAGTAAMLVFVPDLTVLLHDIPITMAVPVAAWVGVFSAEMAIRRRRFTPDSLLRRGGVYPDWRWANLAGLLVATAIGFGTMHAAGGAFAWQGYLMRLIGASPVGEVASSGFGLLVAFVLGMLTPLVTGQAAVRRQESASR